MKKKGVPKLRQEVKVKVDIVTSDDIKIYYTKKFQDFTARYIIKFFGTLPYSDNLDHDLFTGILDRALKIINGNCESP